MKRLFTGVLLLLSTFLASAVADDIYSQSLTAIFATPEDASKAAAEILQFPNGKKIAFSTRWDDTNPRHLDTAKMLSERGLFATCYLVGLHFDKKSVATVSGILELGGAIGAHCISHPHLETLLPNEIFREIAYERAVLESRFDTNVVGFVLPYMSYSSEIDPKVKTCVGLSISNAGYRVSPEIFPENHKRFGIGKSDGAYSSCTFSVNDRNPSRELMLKNIDRARKNISNGAPPHITLGIHSWQDDDGLKRLGEYIDEIKSDDFWYCNENDYAAYRTQFLKSKIRKISDRGNSVLFELSRPSALHIGSDIPLAVKFSVPPVSVFLGAKELSAENGFYNIPQYASRAVPKKIDMLDFTGKGGGSLESGKFKGLDFSFDFDRDSGGIALKYGGKSMMKVSNFRARWIVPPCYATPLDGVAYKGELSLMAKLVPNPKLDYMEAFSEGNMLVMAQCDFLFEGVPARVWLARADCRTVPDSDCARDNAAHLGDFDASLNDSAKFAEFSKPGSVLKDFAGCSWSGKSNKRLREFVVDFNGFRIMKKYGKSQMSYLICADFDAPVAGEYKFFVSDRAVGEIYLNGRKIEAAKSGMKIKLGEGLNRILLDLDNKALRANNLVFAVAGENGLLPCKAPKSVK